LSLNGHFIALFGLASFWALAVAARFYTVSWVGERATADLRSAGIRAGSRPNRRNFSKPCRPGKCFPALTGDTTLIQTVVGSSISMGLRSLFQFVGGMIMLAVTSLYLFSLNLGLMALLTLPIIAIGRKVKKLSRESQDRIADASALAGEILNAMPTVQAYTQETQEARRFAERTETSFVTAIKRTRVRAALTA
jgi:ATP-binding cassette subfamily B protein